MLRQLQARLCLKTGHRPGGGDPLRKLSQVHCGEGEVLHSQGENKRGAWLVAEGHRVYDCLCRGWGLLSRVSLPLAEFIWKL